MLMRHGPSTRSHRLRIGRVFCCSERRPDVKKMQLRYIFVGHNETPVVDLQDDEFVVAAEHEGLQWWVYVAKDVTAEETP